MITPDICRPNHGGSATSELANEVIAPCKARVRGMIRELISASADGLTCDEVELATGVSHQTASARISEMLADGLILVSGRRATRTGCQARVYTTPNS